MGWLIALAVVIGLAVLPLGISAKYDTDGARIRLIAGPVRVTLYPGKKKEKKPSKKKADKPQAKRLETESDEKKGGSVTDFIPLAKIAWNLLCDFRRKLRIKRLEMKVILAGSDPCDLAVNYGRACAALGGLEPQLDRFFVIRKKDLQVACDFVEEKTKVYARLDLTITLGRLLALSVRYGWRALRAFIKINNKRKGGVLQ